MRKSGIDSFKVSIEQYFGSDSIKIKQKRNRLISTFENELTKSDYNATMQTMFMRLYNKIPKDGRIGYDSRNMKNIKSEVDKLTTYILRNNPKVNPSYERFRKQLMAKDDETRRIYSRQRIENVDDYLTTDKTIRDIYRRLGNKVITHALEIKRQEKTMTRFRLKQKKKSLSSLIEEWNCQLKYSHKIHKN